MPSSIVRVLSVLSVSAILACLRPLPAAAQDPWSLCGEQTARLEQQENTPPGLLQAISMVESGRWDENRRASSAWPWTIYADGRGMFFPTKEQAIAAVRQFRSRGIDSIDVGCMQVNLHHHPEAFSSLEQAFDPSRNVAFATKFLKQLFAEFHSWTDAAAAYHSRDEAFAAPYRSKVLQAWSHERDGGVYQDAALYETEASHARARSEAIAYRQAMLKAFWQRKVIEAARKGRPTTAAVQALASLSVPLPTAAATARRGATPVATPVAYAVPPSPAAAESPVDLPHHAFAAVQMVHPLPLSERRPVRSLAPPTPAPTSAPTSARAAEAGGGRWFPAHGGRS